MPADPQRKAPSDPTFHPSRDEPHYIGDVTKTGQGVLLDQGETPSRLSLFGAQGHSTPSGEWAAPENLSRLRPLEEGVDIDKEAEANRFISELGHSQVPVSHWQRSRGDIELSNEGMSQAEGFYRPAGSDNAPRVAARRSVFGGAQRTLIHEMGHAHHYDVTTKAEREHPGLEYRDARGYSPEPLKEAIADAYVDRYGGRSSAAKTEGDYSHISDGQFGYSSNYEAERSRTQKAMSSDTVWVDEDRALYAGTRAHFGETGEIPRLQEGPVGSLKETASPGNFRGVSGRATRDATIAHLQEHSPHARAAFSQLEVGGKSPEEGDVATPMADVVAGAVRRTKDRTLLNQGQFVQESLFGEPEMARNQLGETPRTSEDLHESLRSEMPYWTAGNDRKPGWGSRRVVGRGFPEIEV